MALGAAAPGAVAVLQLQRATCGSWRLFVAMGKLLGSLPSACNVPFASDLADKLQTGKIGCLKQLAGNGLGKHLILVKRPLRQCWPIAWIQDQILPKVCALVAA